MSTPAPYTSVAADRNKWDVLLEWIAHDLTDCTDPLLQEACRRVRVLYGLPAVQFPAVEPIDESQAA
jgi:hypothetical protein